MLNYQATFRLSWVFEEGGRKEKVSVSTNMIQEGRTPTNNEIQNVEKSAQTNQKLSKTQGSQTEPNQSEVELVDKIKAEQKGWLNEVIRGRKK